MLLALIRARHLISPAWLEEIQILRSLSVRLTGEEAHAGGAQNDLAAVVLCARAHHAQIVVHKGLRELPGRPCMATTLSALT